jgi:Flp pilus assembly protein TadB
MAENKEEKPKLSPEEERIEKERLERLKKEEKELKLKSKEKEKRRKERERKIKNKERKEEKRIRNVISFPFKTLFQLSLFFTLVAFLIIYFGNGFDMMSAMYICSLIFIVLYFAVGAVMVIGYWKISEERIQEMEARKKREKEEEEERLKREEEELEKLLKAEIDDIEGESGDDSDREPILLDGRDLENSFDIPEINLDALNDDSSSSYNEDEEIELHQSTIKDEVKEEPDSFFSEDDFMNDVIFGSDQERQR